MQRRCAVANSAKTQPGFVELDPPLLAYFKPESDEGVVLQGSDLKEKFYAYLLQHHAQKSQIIIIGNQHHPSSIDNKLLKTVFTGNPSECTFSFPIGLEATCIGPVLSSRHRPTMILLIPLRPVGYSAACHPNSALSAEFVVVILRNCSAFRSKLLPEFSTVLAINRFNSTALQRSPKIPATK